MWKSDVQKPHGLDASLALLYAVCVIEGADFQLLPASFKALEADLGFSPSHLAILSMSQGIVQFASGLYWGALADSGWSRKWMLTGGATSWGCLTLFLALVSDFPTMVGLRALNGAALGVLQPVAQSLVADIAQPGERGFYFGWIQLAWQTGVLISAIGAASMSNMNILGFDGWRIAFVAVSLASLILAVVLAAFMKEPRRSIAGEHSMSFSREFRKCHRYLRIPTFRVIVVQGLFGSIPWSAMSFAILFFQSSGLSDFHASVAYAASIAGGGIGAVLGGWIGDHASRWSRNHGRPLTAQISVAAGIPMISMILGLVPREEASFKIFFSLMFVFGLVSSWCAAGVNRPILAEIVGVRDRASVFAWLMAMDGAFAAIFGAPVVGMLAEHCFGYQPIGIDTPLASRARNASALSRAMLCCTAGPWIVCFFFYSFLHLTYGPDITASADLDDVHCQGNKGMVTSALM